MTQIKSRDRVRELAEVYTNQREVNAMLDLIPFKHRDEIIRYRYLEPACGNGNFLVEILRRKLERVNAKYAKKSMREYEFYIARTLTTIYGIDICYENVVEARERLYMQIKSNIDLYKGSYLYSPGFFGVIRYILEKNIVLGDSINQPEQIEFTEFKISGRSFEQFVYTYASLIEHEPKPIQHIESTHFLLLGLEHEKKTGRKDEGIQRHLDFI